VAGSHAHRGAFDRLFAGRTVQCDLQTIDETLGNQSRVTVIATGLGSARRFAAG
jgi:hypothetical protein